MSKYCSSVHAKNILVVLVIAESAKKNIFVFTLRPYIFSTVKTSISLNPNFEVQTPTKNVHTLLIRIRKKHRRRRRRGVGKKNILVFTLRSYFFFTVKTSISLIPNFQVQTPKIRYCIYALLSYNLQYYPKRKP